MAGPSRGLFRLPLFRHPCMGLRLSRGRLAVPHAPLATQTTIEVVTFLCSTEAFLRPDRGSLGAPRAAAVKAGRRVVGAASSAIARPCLDGGEHSAKLERSGRSVAT